MKRRDLLAALLILTIPLIDSFRQMYVVDDSFISFRYARNLARGLGLVFNTGERVEGYTNFLWTILLTPSFWLGIDPLLFSRLASAAAALATLLVLLRHGRTYSRPGSTSFGACLPALLLACQASFSVWLLAGMETHLFTLFVTAGILSLRDELREGHRHAWPLLLVIASLTRPEGLLFLALAWAVALHGKWRKERIAGIRDTLSLFLPFIVLFVPYLIWKLVYYGSLVPNTFHAKVGYESEQLARGVLYMKAFLVKSGGILFVVPLVLLLSREGRRLLGFCLVFIAPYCLYVVLVGGDSMAKFRFLLPVLPLISILIGESLCEIAARLARGRAGVLALAGISGLAVFLVFDMDRALIERRRRMVEEWIDAGKWLAAHYPRETRIALGAVGAIPYYSDLYTIDIFGLTVPGIARKKIVGMGTGLAGHEKADAEYVLSRKPDLIFPKVVLRESPPAPDELGVLFTGSLAEIEIWKAPAFEKDYKPVTVRLPGGHLTYFERQR